MVNKDLEKYVSVDKDIMGGEPVITGTRIPVDRIIEMIRVHGYSTEMFQEDYPHVEKKKIQMVVAYLMEAGADVFRKKYKFA